MLDAAFPEIVAIYVRGDLPVVIVGINVPDDYEVVWFDGEKVRVYVSELCASAAPAIQALNEDLSDTTIQWYHSPTMAFEEGVS